jgi:hypothetical protein
LDPIAVVPQGAEHRVVREQKLECVLNMVALSATALRKATLTKEKTFARFAVTASRNCTQWLRASTVVVSLRGLPASSCVLHAATACAGWARMDATARRIVCPMVVGTFDALAASRS